MVLKKACVANSQIPNPVTALAGKAESHLTQINVACCQGYQAVI